MNRLSPSKHTVAIAKEREIKSKRGISNERRQFGERKLVFRIEERGGMRATRKWDREIGKHRNVCDKHNVGDREGITR